MGTLAYMSPEQVRNEPLDRRTDIWSLGVVFDEMLTGKHPFERDNMSAVLLAILEQPPPVEHLDPALAAIVCRALAKDRTHRYNDCREMRADLEGCKSVVDTLPSAPSNRSGRRSASSLSQMTRGRALSDLPCRSVIDAVTRHPLGLAVRRNGRVHG